MSEQLKPCPFCGGDEMLTSFNEVGSAILICMKCDAVGPPAEYEPDQMKAAWNTRTDMAQAAVAAALEKAARIADPYSARDIMALITDAQQAALDAHTQRAVEAERGRNVEWCARALERKAREVVGALHCGSENVEIREARRIAGHYKDAAAYLRALAAIREADHE